MALLITLSIISVLIVTTMELHRRGRSTLTSTAISRDRLTLTHMGASGVHMAMALLVQDKADDPPSGLDSIQEDWANPEILSDLVLSIPFEEGTLVLDITDELGKIQVNTLVKFPEGKEANNPQMFLWDRFLRLIESMDEPFENIEPRTIINSVKDWLDAEDDDTITGLNGAESDYYQGLDPPYTCRNGPIAHLDELVLIKGIIPELYYGFGGMLGISNYMTTTFGPIADGKKAYYTGKININTADLPVIAAMLPAGSEILATEIYEYREEISDSNYMYALSNAKWYQNAPGCSDIEIDKKLIATYSDFFRIKATAAIRQISVTTTAVVRRIKDNKSGKWKCKVLSWQTE